MTVTNLLDLSGRTVLVTGGASGIGAAISRRCAQAGARVILHYHSAKKNAAALGSEINAARIIGCDLSQPHKIKAMINTLVTEDLCPDLLVNNAGVQTLGSIIETKPEVWEGINAVNLDGVYALTKYVSRALITFGRAGAIVNISSIEGQDPARNHAHYAASKAAVLMYTRASALELGEHNIRVNAVAPGLIERAGIAQDWPEGVKSWQDNAPLSRLGTRQDVANAVLFLLSPAAVWISGNTLVVDGGMSAQNRW